MKLSGQPIICQLLSLIPRHLVSNSVSAFDSDKYYKTMSTYNQMVFMLYGIISKANSLNSLCKSLLFLDGKLSYLGIHSLPASSTLSDANINRNSDVFAHLYYQLLDYYKDTIDVNSFYLPLNNEVPIEKVKRFDSTTFSLFVDLFKGAGRNTMNGKKKGGLKAHTVLPLHSHVPELVWLTEAAKNDKDFLGQLQVQKGNIYVFDKGYVNYTVYKYWTDIGVFFVTRLNENARYTVIAQHLVDVIDALNNGGILKDETIQLQINGQETPLILRLVTYKDPLSGKILKFLSNLTTYQATTIALLYKNRWDIEPFYKQLKQNFELGYFYSDSSEGIKTQIWLAFIANLLFTVIHKRAKEAEAFITIVAMAKSNLGSYVCLISILKHSPLSTHERINEIVQFHIFEKTGGGVFNKINKSP